MISSKNERVFICDLNDLTLQIIFDAWWVSMNVGSKHPIAWNSSRHAPSWWFYLHCRIEETSSPAIISIVCHQVIRHPSDHWTSSMSEHRLPKAYIAKLNKLTESEDTELTSSPVDEVTLTIRKRPGSRGIRIESSQWKFTFDFRFHLYWLNWQTKHSKLSAKDFNAAEFRQDTSNHYLMIGFVSGHIPWNTISNIEQRWSYNTLRSELLLPSPSTLSKICWMEYTLTVDEIKKQLLSRNELSLALDGWTSTNTRAITLGIAYYTVRNWELCQIHLAFNHFDSQFFPLFES